MSAKQDARLQEILRLLSDQKKMNVAALAGMLGTSQVTIRKDLDSLEAKGFIRRIHGYAELDTSDHLTSRLAYHYDEKKKIAERASELVSDDDTIMIESGSCCAILADLLAKKCRSLTIITNSAFIADYIRSYKQVQVILLGGIYQHESQCLVGPMIRDGVANYHVRHFFIGTDGWSEKTGFTNKDALRAQAVRDMSLSADEVVILTESEKFSHPGTLPLNIKTAPVRLITDRNLPEEARLVLENRSTEILYG